MKIQREYEVWVTIAKKVTVNVEAEAVPTAEYEPEEGIVRGVEYDVDEEEANNEIQRTLRAEYGPALIEWDTL